MIFSQFITFNQETVTAPQVIYYPDLTWTFLFFSLSGAYLSVPVEIRTKQLDLFPHGSLTAIVIFSSAYLNIIKPTAAVINQLTEN